MVRKIITNIATLTSSVLQFSSDCHVHACLVLIPRLSFPHTTSQLYRASTTLLKLFYPNFELLLRTQSVVCIFL
jgi:hypothetical protein